MKRFCKTLRKLLHNKLAAAGIVICLAMMIIAIFAPFFAPHDPNYQTFSDILQKPSAEYPMGTDNLGRCVYSRVIYGTRITIVVGGRAYRHDAGYNARAARGLLQGAH